MDVGTGQSAGAPASPEQPVAKGCRESWNSPTEADAGMGLAIDTGIAPDVLDR